jgi:hypothetical protein
MKKARKVPAKTKGGPAPTLLSLQGEGESEGEVSGGDKEEEQE